MKKKWIKRVVLIFSILFIIGIIGILTILCINMHVKSSAKDKIISIESAAQLENVDCVLVLGCFVQSDGVPSDMLTDRLLQGVELYKCGVSGKLLMSGDHGHTDYDEVNAMKQFAIDKGIESDDIFMDHAGFSTYESLYRAKDIFKAKKIIIVTQKYHLYRAIYIAQQLGIEAYGVASDQHTYLGQSKREFREILARVKDFFYAKFKPKPTYLGDAIPVNGNGDLTND